MPISINNDQALLEIKTLENRIFRDPVIRNLQDLYPPVFQPGYRDEEYKRITSFFQQEQFMGEIIAAEDKRARYLAAYVLGEKDPSIDAQLTIARSTDRLFTALGVYKPRPADPNNRSENDKGIPEIKKQKKGSDEKMGQGKEVKLPKNLYAVLEVFRGLKPENPSRGGISSKQFHKAVKEKLGINAIHASNKLYFLKRNGILIKKDDGLYHLNPDGQVVCSTFGDKKGIGKPAANNGAKAAKKARKVKGGNGDMKKTVILPASPFSAYKIIAELTGKSNGEFSTSQFMEYAMKSLKISQAIAKVLLNKLKDKGVINSGGYGVYLLNTDVKVVSKHDAREDAKKKPGAKAAKKPRKVKSGNGKVQKPKTPKGKKGRKNPLSALAKPENIGSSSEYPKIEKIDITDIVSFQKILGVSEVSLKNRMAELFNFTQGVQGITFRLYREIETSVQKAKDNFAELVSRFSPASEKQ